MAAKEEGEVRLNEEGKRIPTRADGPTAILRYLMTYSVCSADTEFNTRAVDYLLKKLQDRKKQLHELIEVITWRGTRPSKCFTVPRTLDGRVQVASRKCFPHVAYARIWRWEDLGKCQIIHIPTCKYGFDLNREQICVNPYHYKKITTAEEYYSKLKLTITTEENRNKLKALKKRKEAACIQNTAVKDGEKPQQQQNKVTRHLNTECLIPIVVEHHSNDAEYVEPQQSREASNCIEEPKVQPPIPETSPICDTLYASNNVESAVPSGPINDQRDHSNNVHNVHQPAVESNLPEHNNVKLIQGHDENNRNVKTPAVSLSMCEQVLLNQTDFNLSLSNNQRQDNFVKIINLPAPGNTLLLNNSPLVSNYDQPSNDLVRCNVETVPMNAMPPPLPMNRLPPAVPMDGMPPPLPFNQMPPPVLRNKIPPSVLTNKMPPPKKIPLSSNSIFVNSNRDIKLPPPSSTPLPHNPPTFSDSLFEDEDFQPIEKQHNELQTNCSKKLEDKNMSLNCTIERILKEDQQIIGNNPLENTLNETLDQILSQVQSNDRKLSNTDQKLESALLSNSKVEDLANDSVPMEVSNYEEKTQDNNQSLQPVNNLPNLIQNIEAVSPVSDIPLKNYSLNYENKEKSLNCTFEKTLSADCTIEQILKEGDNQQSANNNLLENTLNETLDQILCQVQNNNHNLSNIDKKLESAVLSNTEHITTQSNTAQLLKSNKDSVDDSVPMEVNNFKDKTQNYNQRLRLINDSPNLRQNVPTINCREKFENKNMSLNCTLEPIETVDCTIERILKEGDNQQTVNNNPLENTLNETLDQILSQVQSNDQKVLESPVLSNTEPITTESNIKQLLSNNKDLAEDNVPMEVNNYEEKTQDHQQLKDICKALNLIQNIKVVSPISNVSPKIYSHKFENKDTSLNCTIEEIVAADCTIERILKEGDNQQTVNNNPLENTLNETLDQILSQVQSNDQKLSHTDKKLESSVLSNTESITTESNSEQLLSSNKDLVDDSVPMEVYNYEEKTQDNQQLKDICKALNLIQNIKVVSPISNVPKNYSRKFDNKKTSLNYSIEKILKEDDHQQSAMNNPLENTLNETLDQILSQVQNNDKKQSNAEQNLESAVVSNNTELMTTQNNIEKVLSSNEDLVDDSVSMEVSNYKSASPICDVPSINSDEKIEKKDLLNCTLERILTEDCSLERVLKEDDSKNSNNPTENTVNETVDQILSEVQNNNNNDKTLSSTEQNLENISLNNATEPMPTQSNIVKVLNNNNDLADDIEPMDVSNYEEVIEQNDNQQLQPISSTSELIENINAISPISAISPLSLASAGSPLSSIMSAAPLSPTSTVRSQSPINNTRSLSPEHFHCDSTSQSLDSDDNKNQGESSKRSKNKRSESDKTIFSDDDIPETMTQNNNKPKSNSLHFSDTMISLINNNIMEQPQMSSISKCEQYLRNQSREINSPAYILSPPSNNNNPEQQDPNPVKSQDAKLKASNFNEFFNIPNINCRNPKNLIPNDDPPLEYWCSIDYFEMDTQVGDTFKVKNEHTTMFVDGYLDPDGGNRFSLGRLTNIHRRPHIDRTRMHIAQGIALELRDEGDIWLTCRSKTSVFIKAPFLDMQSDPTNRNSVHKIFSGECKKVFDLQKCYKHIKAQIATAQAALKVQLMTIEPPERSINNLSGTKGLEAIGMNIDDLRRFCILQISFVKGWGSDYPRQTIKETPCWIEVHIHKALQILDNFLLLEKPIVRGMD